MIGFYWWIGSEQFVLQILLTARLLSKKIIAIVNIEHQQLITNYEEEKNTEKRNKNNGPSHKHKHIYTRAVASTYSIDSSFNYWSSDLYIGMECRQYEKQK